jgi:hypothetical protein
MYEHSLDDEKRRPINYGSSDDVMGWNGDGFLQNQRKVWQKVDQELRNIRKFSDPAAEALSRLQEQEAAPGLMRLSDTPENATRDTLPWNLTSCLNILSLRGRRTAGSPVGKIIIPSIHDESTSQSVSSTDTLTNKTSKALWPTLC